MSAKEVEVTCPCCSARLRVDVLTSKVVRTERAESAEGGDVWTAAMDKVRQRAVSGPESFENALERERNKSARLDEFFERALDKHKRPEPGE